MEIGHNNLFVMPELIGEVMGLDCVGVKIKRKGMMDYRKLRHKFFEGTKEPVRVSSTNEYYKLSLPSFFGAICYGLTEYVTHQGQYMMYHGYYFPFLTMLHHGEKVNIPFFLHSSLFKSIILG